MRPQALLTMLLCEDLHIFHFSVSDQRYDLVIILTSDWDMRLLPSLHLPLACRRLPLQLFQEGTALVRGALEMLLEPTRGKRSSLHEVILRLN